MLKVMRRQQRSATLKKFLDNQQALAAKKVVIERDTSLPEGVELTGYEDKDTKELILACHELRRRHVPSFRPILPLLLQLKGKPYQLDRHVPFEVLFRTHMPRETTVMAARQTSKSTSVAAEGVVTCACIPDFNILYITPLFEQIRRFSQNYVRQFIETSPVRHLFSGTKTINSVLQRSFQNRSNMNFSFAFLDAERTRGLPTDWLVIDEAQDILGEHVPIMRESMSASPWKREQRSGTPKSLDNYLTIDFEDSSQAEWAVKCQHGGCGHWNFPCLDQDLFDMIGPLNDDISEKQPGVVCAKCRHPIDPRRHGHWIHAVKSRRWTHAGYHVPQIVMPMHYADPDAWSILLGKQQGRGNTTLTVFLNEVCAQPYDEGSKLVTATDLKNAAVLPWPNKAAEAVKHLNGYLYKMLAVDWGGGGGQVSSGGKDPRRDQRRLRTSFTSMAVLGIKGNGKIDCIWGHRSLRTHDYYYEAQLIVETLGKFKCSHLVHDYGGAGAIREALLYGAGFPLRNIVPIAYHPSAVKDLMIRHPPNDEHHREWYSVDKARSLATTCQCIKFGLLRFFEYDHHSADDAGLLHDFLALIEEKLDARYRTDVYTIVRNPRSSDDFAQAVNIGCCALWWITKSWPDLSAAGKFRLPPDVLRLTRSKAAIHWDDI